MSKTLKALALAAGLAATSMFAFAHDPAHPDPAYRATDLMELHGILSHVKESASPEQLAKLEALAAAQGAELHRLSKQAMSAHQRKIELLLQDNVDRAALGLAQADEILAADALSRQIDQAMMGLAEALTPQQRAEFREHVKSHEG